jgi:hypothetical protein
MRRSSVFSIRRTIALIGVLSCGIPAVVTEVFQLFLVRVLSGPRFLRGPLVTQVVTEQPHWFSFESFDCLAKGCGEI